MNPFSWRRANQVMLVVDAAAGIGLVGIMFWPRAQMGDILKARELRRIDAVLRSAGAAAQQANRPREGRNIFQAVRPPAPKPAVVAPPAAPPPPPRIPLSERASYLKLVGIVDGNPRQAMFEDTRANKTLYVSPGDTIGEIKVLEISEGAVVLSFEDEQMRMSL